MSLEESDSHVNVNCVLVGVGVCCSSMLACLGPVGGGANADAAALAMAVEMIPWSGFSDESPEEQISKGLVDRETDGCVPAGPGEDNKPSRRLGVRGQLIGE